MTKDKTTTVQLWNSTITRLRLLKIIPRETYDDVIKRLILSYEEHNNDRG